MDSDREYTDADTDSDIDIDSDIDVDQEKNEQPGCCPICKINSINDKQENERTCSICKDIVCLQCVAITKKNVDIGECVNCFNKECQECISDITKQLEEYLEENELPLYIEDSPQILNCKECYEKYY